LSSCIPFPCWCHARQWLCWVGEQLAGIAGTDNPSLTICSNMVSHIPLAKIMGFRDRNGIRLMQYILQQFRFMVIHERGMKVYPKSTFT
jgi:hypothetical protein